jgi:hypothetical protein
MGKTSLVVLCSRHLGMLRRQFPRVGESASRPPCGFWRLDDQQLEI